jgi:hypothetical protein
LRQPHIDMKYRLAAGKYRGFGFYTHLKGVFIMGLILLIVLVLLLLSVLPTWGYSNKWGYGPSGALGSILLVVIVLLLMGVIPGRF